MKHANNLKMQSRDNLFSKVFDVIVSHSFQTKRSEIPLGNQMERSLGNKQKPLKMSFFLGVLE